MAYNINTSNVAVRETRLGSISSFSGNLETLAYRSRNCSLKNCERCFSQASFCLSAIVVNQLSYIRDAAIVYHAPAGCATNFANRHILASQVAARIGKKTNNVLVCTDLNEEDTVFGAVKSLKEIITKTYHSIAPKAIFVLSSCASATIGEDIDTVSAELREELNIPIVSVRCEGYRSRLWASGFDIVSHALLNGIIKSPKEKRKVINFQNFNESRRVQVTELFKTVLGYDTQFFFSNSTIEELSHMSESAATVAICGTLGTYMGNGLEQLYGVPYIKTINPHGIEGFETWFRAIGAQLGKSEEVEKYIEENHAVWLPKIETIKTQLQGIMAVVGAGSGFAYEVSWVLSELGIKIVHQLAWHHDIKNDDGKIPQSFERLSEVLPNETEVSVTELQNHQIINVLNRVKPDIFIYRHQKASAIVSKLGIPTLCINDDYMMFGYEGLYNFGREISDILRNRSLVDHIKQHSRLPYTKWWYTQEESKFLQKSKGI